jgi:hypothetical protein
VCYINNKIKKIGSAYCVVVLDDDGSIVLFCLGYMNLIQVDSVNDKDVCLG